MSNTFHKDGPASTRLVTEMLVVERRSRIREVVQTRRIVSTEELARDLDVSTETVRRDLIQLDHQGLLRRVHGGAAVRSTRIGAEAAFDERAMQGTEAKSAIASVAAGLVRPGQTIVIDVGTTAVEVARALPDSFSGTVATCSLLVAAQLASRPNVDVLVAGGRVLRGDLAVSGASAVAFFADLRADIAFLGSGAVDADAGLTDFHVDEVATRRVILATTARSFVLADWSKFGRVAPHRVCGLDDVAAIITDRAPPASLMPAIDRAHTQIYAAS